MFPFCTTCSPLAGIQALSLPASTLLLPRCLQIPSTLIRILYPSGPLPFQESLAAIPVYELCPRPLLVPAHHQDPYSSVPAITIKTSGHQLSIRPRRLATRPIRHKHASPQVRLTSQFRCCSHLHLNSATARTTSSYLLCLNVKPYHVGWTVINSVNQCFATIP
ncbi:hypothetical protein C8R43DRAFT_969128 [Mycena crocata]|nr:hypothetical protein C8R43DRAFT_969128 [Mycena crocata]